MNFSSETTGSEFYVHMIPSQDLLNYYKNLQPSITSGDIHICGLCKQTFEDIQSFVLHKTTCGSVSTAKIPPATSLTTTTETTMTVTAPSAIDAPVNYLIEDQLIHLTCENTSLPLSIIADEMPSAEKPGELLHSHHLPSPLSTEPSPQKRDFQVDEEDVASLLANQLPKEVLSSTAHSVFQRPDEQMDHIVILQDPNEGKIDRGEISNPKVNNSDQGTVLEENAAQNKPRAMCSVCSFVTKHPNDLVRHMRKHTGERPYECNICGRRFARSDKMQTHKRIHTGEKRYKCQMCNYASVDSGPLRKHLRVHTDERPHKCQICPYRSRDSSQLTVHLRTHTGDCPFVCQVKTCGRAFKTSTDLKRHTRTHARSDSAGKQGVESSRSGGFNSDQTMFVCPLSGCNFMSESATVYHEHTKTHQEAVSDENTASPGSEAKKQKKEFYCHICSTNYQYKSKLASHMKKHQSQSASGTVRPMCQKSYQCMFCSCAFVRPDSLRSHIKQHQQNKDLQSEHATDIIINDAVVDVPSSLTSDPRNSVIFCINSSQNGDVLFSEESSSIVMKTLDDGSVQYIMLPLKLNK